MPFYPAAVSDVHPAAVPGTVACRCCPGRLSRSARARRYPSDMSEAEWAVCEPLLPAPAWLAGHGGRPASWCMRDIVDAIRYLTHNGPVWRALPADFPPAGTVYWWADKWQADGSAERMHDDLRDRVRAAAGRTAAPTAAVIDSQSVKGSEMIGRARRGYAAPPDPHCRGPPPAAPSAAGDHPEPHIRRPGRAADHHQHPRLPTARHVEGRAQLRRRQAPVDPGHPGLPCQRQSPCRIGHQLPRQPQPPRRARPDHQLHPGRPGRIRW